MSARIIDGRVHARRVREQVAREADRMAQAGAPLHLVSISVGGTPAVDLYMRNQARACEELGIRYTHRALSADTEENELLGHLKSLGYDPGVTGVILQLPLPEHIDPRVAQAAIHPGKDVEGVSPVNLGRMYHDPDVLCPCTAQGVLTLLELEGTPLSGIDATLVGASAIVGRPLAQQLLHRGVTPTICQITTRDLAAHCRRAELLIVAVGKPGLIRAEMVRPGATVIDVGINRVPLAEPGDGPPQTRTVGDVDFDGVREVAGALTPVPGGVGPMTVATLLANIVRCRQLEGRRW